MLNADTRAPETFVLCPKDTESEGSRDVTPLEQYHWTPFKVQQDQDFGKTTIRQRYEKTKEKDEREAMEAGLGIVAIGNRNRRFEILEPEPSGPVSELGTTFSNYKMGIFS